MFVCSYNVRRRFVGGGIVCFYECDCVCQAFKIQFFHFLGSDKDCVCRAVWRSMLRALRQWLLPSRVCWRLLGSQGHRLLRMSDYTQTHTHIVSLFISPSFSPLTFLHYLHVTFSHLCLTHKHENPKQIHNFFHHPPFHVYTCFVQHLFVIPSTQKWSTLFTSW